MLRKISRRWWLIPVCAFLLTLVGAMFAAYVNYNTEPLYIARTVIMEALGPPIQGQPDYYKMRLGNLGSLVTSQLVISNAAQTLWDLGLKYSPEQILASAEVIPVKDTSMIAIEVTLPDPNEAKVAADVIASEAKNAYASSHSGPTEPALRTIDPAYVRPVDQHKALKLGLGLIGGVLFGAVLGLILAAALPCRTDVNHVMTEQGV